MKFFYLILLFLTFITPLKSEVIFEGLLKLNKDDLQSLTEINLYNKEYSKNEIDIIINDLYYSKLISEINYKLVEEDHIFTIYETPLIENIYLNGNIFIKDEFLISNISSKEKTLFDKEKIIFDINLIKNLYSSQGYNSVSVDVKSEKFNSKINLIYTISEGTISSLKKINFNGNSSFSDNFIYSLINSKTNNRYNIFSSGSNLNSDTFEFDKNKIINFYKNKGFFDVKVSYVLNKNTFNQYELNFFINEGIRLKIDEIIYEYLENTEPNIFTKEIKAFSKKVDKNNDFFDSELINDHLINLNESLYSINLINYKFTYDFLFENDSYSLYISEQKSPPKTINRIIITGNSITKDKTLRSKISLEPGDYLDGFKLKKSQNDLSKLKYVNSLTTSEIENGEVTDVIFDINENTKTGNFLLGGSFSGDTGFGIGFGLKDYNILGTGNEIDLSINANSEKSLFSLNYSQYSLLNSNLINTYSIFNQENDLSSSFGFKSRNQGLGYGLSYVVNDTLSFSIGAEYESIEGHSPSNNSSYIIENIENFDQVVLDFTIKNNFTDNYLYPTDGYENSFSLKISPEQISDDSYFRLLLVNKLYKNFEQSDNFLFIANNIGIADSFDGNLKTINAFSLGGLNFKGFDYRGVGPIDNKIYLGGNKYFTTTVGYGSSFLFDEKDNINLKLFTTFGSIWDSDYSSNNDFELRSSAGISFDFITAVGPVSFSYAIPLQKQEDDKSREFNFSIGTSF